jgi:hypothetical protein
VTYVYSPSPRRSRHPVPILLQISVVDDPKVHKIVAMDDAYVDLLTPGGALPAGTPLFKLNDPELTLETFKLRQEQLLTKITADRLSDDYVKRLIEAPMKAAIDFATADLAAAKEETNYVQARIDLGTIGVWRDVAQEIVGLVQERTVLLERSRADLIQRQIEIDGQRRRLKAEQDDLQERIELDNQIQDLHRYVMPAKGTVEFETYSGAFVKKKDIICSIRFD